MSGSNVVSGVLAAVGDSKSKPFVPRAMTDTGVREFNFTLTGTFVGSARVLRSFDGTNWSPCTSAGAAVTFTAPCTEVLKEPEPGVQYAVDVTALTSGSVNWRFSQ